MNEFCLDCGTKLVEDRDLRKFWIRLLGCPSCSHSHFLEVADLRWVFPLQRLQVGSYQAILDADDDRIQEAVVRIRQIDFKTVTIVDFERVFLSPAVPPDDA